VQNHKIKKFIITLNNKEEKLSLKLWKQALKTLRSYSRIKRFRLSEDVLISEAEELSKDDSLRP
jgi:hypothetical protein